MIHLTRRDPSKNMARFYALDIHPDLFGAWLLTAEWGRICQSGTYANTPFPIRPWPPPCFAPPSTANAARDMFDAHNKTTRRAGWHCIGIRDRGRHLA